MISNQDEISDNSTYDKLFSKPKGMEYVFINDVIAVRCGEIVASNLGKAIKKKN